MVHEKLREVFAAQVAVTVTVELQQPTGQLVSGNDFPFAETAAEFNGEIEAGHALDRLHHDATMRLVPDTIRAVAFRRIAVILAAALVVSCATTPTVDPTAVIIDDVNWSAWTARARELLQRLVAIDTSQPRGARRSAAEVLDAFLRRASVQAEVLPVGKGRVAVWARVEAQEARGPPVVLVSHLDTPSFDRAAWPAQTPPLALTVEEEQMWGLGVEGGKTLAVLHATTLAILGSIGGPPQRDVHMVALPDALELGSRSLDKIIAAVPSLATATVALSGGGYDVIDWFGDGRTVQAIAVGERPTAIVQVAALTRSDGLGPRSGERLAQALVAIQNEPPKPRLTPLNRALINASAEGLTAPQRWLIRSSIGAKLVVLPEVLKRPGLSRQFVDEVRTVRVEAGQRGRNISPYRSRALLRARLLEDSTPASIMQSLRKAVDDPDVHITVRTATQLSASDVTSAWIDRIRRGAKTNDEVVTVPILAERPQGCAPLRGAGVPVYGYAPLAWPADAVESDRPVPLLKSVFREGVERMTTLVVRLSAR